MAETDAEKAPELAKDLTAGTTQSTGSYRSTHENGDHLPVVDPDNKPLRSLSLIETVAAVCSKILSKHLITMLINRRDGTSATAGQESPRH
jgi:hypothetical protein